MKWMRRLYHPFTHINQSWLNANTELVLLRIYFSNNIIGEEQKKAEKCHRLSFYNAKFMKSEFNSWDYGELFN